LEVVALLHGLYCDRIKPPMRSCSAFRRDEVRGVVHDVSAVAARGSAFGFSKRFGIVAVVFDTRRRTRPTSGLMYSSIVQTNPSRGELA